MCGIVAYIGDNNGVPIVLDGLSKLEYRGYDSAGIALILNDGIKIERAKGKLENLTKKVFSQDIESNIAIGHTRWATHGRPSEINAHPHFSDKIALVHNGIVENYLELRQFIKEKGGYEFYSDTDSEVLAHLLDFHYKKNNDILKSISEVVDMIEGSYALAIIHEDVKDKIFLTRRSSPLVAAISEDGAFAASDVPAVLKFTRDFVYLEDNDIAIIDQKSLTVYDKNLKAVERKVNRIDWNPSMAEKGGYRHFMLKEIHEQDRAIMDTLRGRINRSDANIDLFDNDIEFLKSANKIFLVACGTSWHAALVAKYYIENLAGIPVEVDLASEFRYRNPILREGDIVTVVSQSGETADTLAALHMASKKGIKTVAICNVVGSTIARDSDNVIYTYAGPEIGVASTKAFTTQVTVMYLLALKLAIIHNKLSSPEVSEHISYLSELPEIITDMLSRDKEIEKIAHKHFKVDDFLFLGRGYNYPIALEGALKLKEISYIHAEGYPAGELKHGPLALVDENIPVVAIIPQNEMYGKMYSNVKEVAARDGIIISFYTEGDNQAEEISNDMFAMPNVNKWLEPLIYIIPLQLLSYYIAVNKGTDVDQPRNLAKSVTVE